MNLFTDFLARLSDSPEPMTDLMVDTETTGTDPYHNAMIQLAAIEFNYETQEIGRRFNRCLSIPLGRYWSESTREWWGKNPNVLQGIFAKMEDPNTVMQDFFNFVRQAPNRLRFWSRGSFDFWFVQSYLERLDLPMPFAFWEARDLRSHISGLYGKPYEPDLSWITLEGDAHNALYDCVIQLKRLFSACNGVFHEVLPPEENAA